jgi:glycosyltransferase involved in cell wall biosynthesis
MNAQSGGIRQAGNVPDLRILHLANHCDRGGNVHIAVDLACMQALQGHDVTYASSGGRYQNLLETTGVRHQTVVQNLRSPQTAGGAFRRLLAISRELNVDIIHAHMMSGAMHGYLVSRLLGLPLVTTIHNSFDSHSWLMRLADRVVAVSASERDLLLVRGYSVERLDMVLNGTIGSPRYGLRVGPAQIRLCRPCITSLCGLEKRKGVHDLVEAFGRAAPQATEWHLYIAGDGPERGALEEQARRSGVTARIHFLGHVERTRDLLVESDVFVLASYAEPFGLGVLEAREAGCALIATHVGGIVEQLGSGRFGRMVAPGDPQALADELAEIMTSPARLLAARTLAGVDLERYRVERMAMEYMEVYRAAIASRSASTSLLAMPRVDKPSDRV